MGGVNSRYLENECGSILVGGVLVGVRAFAFGGEAHQADDASRTFGHWRYLSIACRQLLVI